MAEVQNNYRDTFLPPPIRPRNRESFVEVSKLNLHKESDRRRSFEENGWSNEFVKYKELALLGFYFYKGPDVVMCYFCRTTLNEFEPNDKVLKEHLRFSPNCPLLIRRRTDNEPLSSADLDNALPPASYDECGRVCRKKSKVEEDVAYPQFRLPSARMETFGSWPVGIKQKPEDLCAAGFFYSGKSDCTICFACGVHIGKWVAGDNPWVEHKKLLERECTFLQLNSDQLEINQKKHEEENRVRVEAAEEKNVHENCGKESYDESLCKVCLSNKSSIAFLPCKHVVVCGECVKKIKGKCPVCRAEIKDTIRLYYA